MPKRAPGLFLILVLVALGCGCAHSSGPLPDARDFDPGEKAVIDDAYRFRLAAPGDRWVLLDGENARALAPDARVMAFLPGAHVRLQVYVERADGVDLEDVAELHAAALELRPETRRMERVQHQGRDALKLKGVRVTDGEIDLRSLVVRHQGHVYELRVFGPRGGVPAPGIDAFYDAAVRRFSLLSGAVRPPPPAVTAAPDSRGPGWRVRGGVFESANAALRVAPPAGWRLVLGSELEAINPDAEIGLLRADPPLSITVVSERVEERDLEAVRKRSSAQVALVEGGERRALRWGGKPLEFAQIRPEGMPESVVVLSGFRFQRGRNYQLVLAHGAGEGGVPHLQTGLDAVSFLEPDAEHALARELSALPDSQARLLGKRALWGGRFRDFERGITWVKPDREWTAHIGKVATDRVEGSILVFEHERYGLIGYLLPFDDLAGDARALLRSFVSGIVSEGRAQQIPIRALSLDADSSAACETDATVEGLPFGFAMASAVNGKRGVVLVVNGLRENMRNADAQVKAALAGLQVSRAPLPEQSATEGAFTSWRYGIRFTPPGGFTWSGPQQAKRGRMDLFSWSAAEQMIGIGAASLAGSADRGRDALRIGMESQLKAFPQLGGAPPAVSEHVLAGHSARRISVHNDEMRVDVFAISRGDHVYFFIVAQQGANASAERADAAAAGFEVLD